MLPTTFDSDPQLRFSSGVIIVLVCALLTAGYALTALLYYAVPSPIFRLESLLIPAASASFFGLCAAAWTLVSSPRFDPTLPGCPVTLAITFFSVLVYGTLGWWTSHKIKKITDKKPWPVNGSWHDSNSAHHASFSSTYPLTAGPPADNNGMYYAHPLQDYSHPVQHDYANPVQHDYANPVHDYANPAHDYVHPSIHPSPAVHTPISEFPPSTPAPRVAEQDMVGQQMAGLLTKPTPVPSPDATQQTFHLEWPPGGDDASESPHRTQSQSIGEGSSGQLLSPRDAARQARSRSGSDSGIPVIRVGTLSSPEDRGRRIKRKQEEKEERTRSRDERRREIERNSIT
jgi:hypothetical protein